MEEEDEEEEEPCRGRKQEGGFRKGLRVRRMRRGFKTGIERMTRVEFARFQTLFGQNDGFIPRSGHFMN